MFLRNLKWCFFVALLAGAAYAQVPDTLAVDPVPERNFIERHYDLSLERDLPLTFLSGFISVYGDYRLHKMAVNTEMRDVSDLLPWDRPVAGRYCKACADVSTWSAALGVAPLALGAFSWYKGDASGGDLAAYTLMLAQALALQNGVNLLVRTLSFWPRPYMYATEGDGAEAASAAEGEAYGSFYSGHASAAFTIAVFTGEWFSEFYPNSRYKSLVWATSLSLASLVGVLRVAAGRHYPTDVAVGALAGAGISLAVIKIHKKSVRIGPVSLAGVWAGPEGASLAFVF